MSERGDDSMFCALEYRLNTSPAYELFERVGFNCGRDFLQEMRATAAEKEIITGADLFCIVLGFK